MERLWIADVHANLPAFEAVLGEAGDADEIIFLGDIVGYGPHPAACVERLMALSAQSVLGNHDTAVLAWQGRAGAQTDTLNWDQWTMQQLDEAQLSYLSALPKTLAVTSGNLQITALHHLASAPYLHPAMPDAVLSPHFQDLPGPLVFCGHSHRPMDRTVNGRRVVCIPSVGQPRNGDPRAGYAREQDGCLTFHAVVYDVERVIADIERIGLAEAFCRRWVNFVRTGFDVEWSREYAPEGHQ